MKRQGFFLLFLFFFFSTAPLSLSRNSPGQNLEATLSQLQKSLDNRDFELYLSAFSCPLREKERAALSTYFESFQIETISLFNPHIQSFSEKEASVILSVVLQNPHTVIMEIWRLKFLLYENTWEIIKKSVLGNTRTLYKISMPSERVERAQFVEIQHKDIQITFKEALIFYDNIPEFETALLVVGKGQLHFSPSLEREKHNLKLIYKKRALKERLKYAYFRFSHSFFEKNIKIISDDKDTTGITQSEWNRAYALFSKHYSRSFTIENSLDGQLLSFLPQGEEVVFEFDGEKIGTHSYIYSPFAEEEINFYQWKDNKIINLYSPPSKEGMRKLYISFGKMFDVEKYEIGIDFNPKEYFLSGKASIAVKSLVQSLDGIKLKLNPDLEILRIQDEEKYELFYTQDRLRRLVYIYFLQSPPKGENIKITLYYRGKIKPPQLGADVVEGSQLDESVPVFPIHTETYFYSHSALWYPAPPDEDYFQAQVRILIPHEYSCVASGKFLEMTQMEEMETVEDVEKMGWSVYSYATEYPLKYLAFIVGRFSKVREDLSDMPLSHFRTSNIRSLRWDIFEETRNILRFYEERYGPYPFEKMTIIQRTWLQSGGHSPPSFIVLNELPRLQRQKKFVSSSSPVSLDRWEEYFLAHEIAHQWWGQAVTWATYHDQWISEGLAQFSAVLYLRGKYGERTFSQILDKFSYWTEKKAEMGAITMGSRISYVDFEAYQSIIYNKTALVLNMLRTLVGEAVFFQGMKEFLERHKYTAVRTNDFMKAMEDVSGKNLETFFSSWFNSYNLPEVGVSKSVQKQKDGYLLHLRFVQLKDLFEFPLEVEWKEGKEKISHILRIDKRRHEFTFVAAEKPKKIKVNPNHSVPGKFR